ncbi:MAG: PIG-L family deacetylase [Planctomycetes bacterium]|nr:PIG-L family deacetylase [Planctomycetota bacterium]
MPIPTDVSHVKIPFPLPGAHAAPPRGKVAIVAPHPDDEAIGCGGAYLKHRDAGDPVRVLVVTDGRAGNVTKQLSQEEYTAARRRESLEAARILGGADYTFLDFPDSCEITENALAEVAEKIAGWLRADMPDIIYIPWIGEGNSDHAAVGEASRRALLAAGFRGVALGYEIYCPAPIDAVLDITDVADRKREAIECFESQLDSTPIEHLIFGLNAARALYLPKGARYGEGFVVWHA